MKRTRKMKRTWRKGRRSYENGVGQNVEVRVQLGSLSRHVPVYEDAMKQRTSCALEIMQGSIAPPGFLVVPHKGLVGDMPEALQQHEGPSLGGWQVEKGRRKLG